MFSKQLLQTVAFAVAFVATSTTLNFFAWQMPIDNPWRAVLLTFSSICYSIPSNTCGLLLIRLLFGKEASTRMFTALTTLQRQIAANNVVAEKVPVVPSIPTTTKQNENELPHVVHPGKSKSKLVAGVVHSTTRYAQTSLAAGAKRLTNLAPTATSHTNATLHTTGATSHATAAPHVSTIIPHASNVPASAAPTAELVRMDRAPSTALAYHVDDHM